jgi:hypothetical protein
VPTLYDVEGHLLERMFQELRRHAPQSITSLKSLAGDEAAIRRWAEEHHLSSERIIRKATLERQNTANILFERGSFIRSPVKWTTSDVERLLPNPTSETLREWRVRADLVYREVQEAQNQLSPTGSAGFHTGWTSKKPNYKTLDQYVEWFVLHQVCGLTYPQIAAGPPISTPDAVRQGILKISQLTQIPVRPRNVSVPARTKNQRHRKLAVPRRTS